jgi:hypothetical protein
MSYMPTVKELFDKYNIDYSNIKRYKPLYKLNNGRMKDYTIENHKRYINTIIIITRRHNNKKYAPIEYFDIEQILQIKININTWNIYRWGGYMITEYDVINIIYEKLTK